ncbi:hypothetical protein AKO1_012939 [Acrasis kona]|uniref:Coenzyme Q-binding protein COQ10 START domain-containing protein n=1 Tax=Acrasis kona TaxID=1008807 RepID=A0AAW2YZ74_9EUKA
MWGWITGTDAAATATTEEQSSTGYESGNVSEKIIFNAPLEVALQVITDYEKYPEFVTGSYEAKKVKTDQDGGQVVFYSSSLSFKTIDYTLIHYLNPEKDGITWKNTDDGPWAKNVGGWKLKKISDTETEATYYVVMELSIWTPAFLKDWIISSQLPAMLEAFKKRVEEVYAKQKK